MAFPEPAALAAVLEDVEPNAPTACAGWTVHDIAAHLTAGAEEMADLIEEHLAGLPPRETRRFEERERPFRAMRHDELMAAMAAHSRRNVAATRALAEQGEEGAVAFTGASMTADLFVTHARSEAAIHRWDIVGDDHVADELLAQPELTRHAVAVLNAMPTLAESSRLNRARPARRLVLRSPGEPDIVLTTGDRPRIELVESGPAQGDGVVTTDAAHRLLVIWGRRSSTRDVTVEADPDVAEQMAAWLWPSAQPWG